MHKHAQEGCISMHKNDAACRSRAKDARTQGKYISRHDPEMIQLRNCHPPPKSFSMVLSRMFFAFQSVGSISSTCTTETERCTRMHKQNAQEHILHTKDNENA